MSEKYTQLLKDTRAKFKELDERQESLSNIVSKYRSEVAEGTGTSQQEIEYNIKKKAELRDFEQELESVTSQRKELLENGSKLLGNELLSIKKESIDNFKTETLNNVAEELETSLYRILSLINKTDLELKVAINNFESEVFEEFDTFLTSEDLDRVTSPYLITIRGTARDILSKKDITTQLSEIKEHDLNHYLEEGE